jgi:CubicO group peptidase (beta-lactamase class C family)
MRGGIRATAERIPPQEEKPMRRRELISLFGGAAAAYSLRAKYALTAASPHKEQETHAKEPAPTSESLVDQQLRSWMAKRHVPGLAACILNENKIVWRKGYGMANIAKQIPFSPDHTLFQIASVTKTITATAIMQLRDKGLLRLDDDVNDFLHFSVRNPHHPDRQITFRSLLKHTSSISDSEAIYAMCAPGDPTVSLEEVMTRYFTPKGRLWHIKHYSKDPPGINERYSNAGFSLLGYLVEVISKLPLEEYLQHNIFGPLKMSETSLYIEKLDRQRHARPYTYAQRSARQLSPGYGDGNLLPVTVLPRVGYNEHALYSCPTLADSMIRTSVNQLANFLIAIMDGGRFEEAQVLKEETVNEMLAQKLGWFKTGQYWGHDGSDPGCSTEASVNPKTKIGLIIFANTDIELNWVKAFLLAKAEEKRPRS